MQIEGGRLVAAAALEEALYARLASAPAGEGPRIGLTYRDRSGSTIAGEPFDAAAEAAAKERGWR